MTFKEACELMEKYAQCPKCGSATVGGGKGAISVDTAKGIFARSCSCGWGVFIRADGKRKGGAGDG